MDTIMSLTKVIVDHCVAVVANGSTESNDETTGVAGLVGSDFRLVENMNIMGNHLVNVNDNANFHEHENRGGNNLGTRDADASVHPSSNNNSNFRLFTLERKQLPVSRIDDLSYKIFQLIFSYLNPSDLIHSRFVSRSWNDKICKNPRFLSSIVFQVNVQSLSILSASFVPWENISICYIDDVSNIYSSDNSDSNPDDPPPSPSLLQLRSRSRSRSRDQPAKTGPGTGYLKVATTKAKLMKNNISLSPPDKDKESLLPEPEQEVQAVAVPIENDWPQLQRLLCKVKYLDFRCSIFKWPAIQRFLSWTKPKTLEQLSFDRCTLLFSDPVPKVLLQKPTSTSLPLPLRQHQNQKTQIKSPSSTSPSQSRYKSREDQDQEVIDTTNACNSVLQQLKILTVQDVGRVDKMTGILIKLVERKMTNLEKIYIVFDSNINHFFSYVENNNNESQPPPYNSVVSTTTTTDSMSITATSIEHANVFHYNILQLLQDNWKTLRCLYFNLRDQTLMTTFCNQVLDQFQPTIEHLEEFQLTPFFAEYVDVEKKESSSSSLSVSKTDTSSTLSASSPSPSSLSSYSSSTSGSQTETETSADSKINSHSNATTNNNNGNSTAAMLTLMKFFSRHPTLKQVSFPHFNTRSSNDFRRRKMFRNLPKTVERLNLPGYAYLVPDFLSQLPKLKSLFMGSIPGKPFHPNSYRYAPNVCQMIEEVGVSTRIHLRPGKLVNFTWKFPKLTKLEFDALRSVVNDLDLQGIILNCPWLRYLSIFGCDLITDFGVTGSSLDLCKDIFRLGVIYSHPSNEIPQRTKYKPINTLKGLRTLILRGNTKITDVGIFYGFRFQELKHLWIPYSERITGWGIRQLGCWNPSLEAIGVTAINVTNTDALNDLTKKHPRISADRILVQTLCDESPSIMSSPSMLTSLIDD